VAKLYCPHILEGLVQHLPIEEQQSVERLVLSCRGDMAVDSQVTQELLGFGLPRPQFRSRLHPVETHVAPDPVAIRRRGPDRDLSGLGSRERNLAAG
jgi:hypothetical protein